MNFRVMRASLADAYGPKYRSRSGCDPLCSHQSQAGKRVRYVQSEREEGFVISKIHVVRGLVLLDKIVFKDERFFFRFREDGADTVHPLHEEPDAGPLIPSLDKVVPHSVAQVSGFADVQDLALAICHEIDARARGQVFQKFFSNGHVSVNRATPRVRVACDSHLVMVQRA